MTDQSPLSEWLAPTGGALVAGGAIKWLWDKVIGWRADREAKIEAREDEYVSRVEQRLKSVEALVQNQAEAISRHSIALAILIAKVERDDPAAPELAQVHAILGPAFPFDVSIPPEMGDMLKEIR